MAKKTDTKEINGYTYAVTQMGALRGRRVITRLLQVAGGALSSVMQAQGKADRSDAFKGALEGINDETMEYFYSEFASDTVVTIPKEVDPNLSDIERNEDARPDRVAMLKNKEAFDDVFINRYADMFQWLVFAFEVNFGSFLVESGSLMSSMAAKFGINLKPQPQALKTSDASSTSPSPKA